MYSNLIFDIGSFKGQDSEYYLKKGFLVVAVEANPVFAEANATRNASYVNENELLVLNAGISETDGERLLYVHSHEDWTSFNKNVRFAEGTYQELLVKTISAASLFDLYGAPYYLKIDIEGLDHLLVAEVCRREDKPEYVSYELGSNTRVCLEQLAQAGYDSFQLSNQSVLPRVKMSGHQLEGHSIEYAFTSFHSGPFGLDLRGSWLSYAEMKAAIDQLQKPEGMRTWYDVHARLKRTNRKVSLLQSVGAGHADGAVKRPVPPVKESPAVARPSQSPGTLDAVVKDIAKDWANAPYYEQAEMSMDGQWNGIVYPILKGWTFGNVVDLAAGHGRNTAKLLQYASKVWVVDANKTNIDFCRNRFAADPRVDYVVCDGLTLRPIPDGSVDLVYSFDAIVHFDSDIIRSYLVDIARVLRKEGRAFLHHSNMTSNPTGSFRDTPGWRNYMSDSLMAHWAAKAGLRVLSQTRLDWRHDGAVIDCITCLEK